MTAGRHFEKMVGALSPDAAASYLRRNGWSLVGHQGENAEVWVPSSLAKRKPANVARKEVVIPKKREFKDFTENMTLALRRISEFQEKSLHDLISEIYAQDYDVLKIGRTVDDRTQCIPLVDGKRIIENAIEMITSSARSVIKPRAYYASRKPKRVEKYLSDLRLGHTEYGSFVVAIRSPVAPYRTADELGELFSEAEAPTDEPFERRALLRFAEATSTAINLNPGDVEKAPEWFIDNGVNSNLCSALAELKNAAGESHVSLNLEWSKGRPVSRGVSSQYQIGGKQAEILEEAGNILRSFEPETGVEIRGYVIKLGRGIDEKEGHVTIFDFTHKPPRRVVMDLYSEAYQKAISAHSNGTVVRCVGDIRRKPKSVEMEAVKEFELMFESG